MPDTYCLQLREPLPPKWAEWFAPLTLIRSDADGTVLRGPIADQAALHGLLARCRDLNLTIMALTNESRPTHTGD